jgi:hypothetical protein
MTVPTLPLSQFATVTTVGRWMPPLLTAVNALANWSPDTTSGASSWPRRIKPYESGDVSLRSPCVRIWTCV